MWDVAVITGGSVGNRWVFLSSFMSIDWDKIDLHRAINKEPLGYLQPVSHIWKRQLILNSNDQPFIIMTILNVYNALSNEITGKKLGFQFLHFAKIEMICDKSNVCFTCSWHIWQRLFASAICWKSRLAGYFEVFTGRKWLKSNV